MCVSGSAVCASITPTDQNVEKPAKNQSNTFFWLRPPAACGVGANEI
jgi:hypothetical protein